MSEVVQQHAIEGECAHNSKRARVCIVDSGNPVYPRIAPYHPSQRYPEYPFSNALAEEANYVYDAARRALRDLGYDA